MSGDGYNSGIDGITIEWCERDTACKDFMNFKWSKFYTEKDCLGMKIVNRFDAQKKHGGHPLIDFFERPLSIQCDHAY